MADKYCCMNDDVERLFNFSESVIKKIKEAYMDFLNESKKIDYRFEEKYSTLKGILRSLQYKLRKKKGEQK
jgi:hypothetical protein